MTNAVLPFILKVTGTDEFRGVRAVSTSFRFRGLMQFDGASLLIEWAGEARVQDVGALSVRDERLPLPSETLNVPVERLRAIDLVGGWWRPRLEISAKDLHVLASVPSEEWGKVRFWYARRDRAIAVALSAVLSRAIATSPLADDARTGSPLSHHTPA